MYFLNKFSKKNSNTKFYHYPSYESRVVPCGQMHRQTDGHTEMTKLIVAFRNFANEPKNTRLILMTFLERNSLLHKIVSRYAITFCALPKCGTTESSILTCLKNFSLHLSSFFQIAITFQSEYQIVMHISIAFIPLSLINQVYIFK